MTRNTKKAVLVGIALVLGGTGLVTLLAATTDAPHNRCIVCGEAIKSPHSMLWYVFNGGERAFHMACISTAYRDYAETRMRELAKEHAKQIDDSGRHVDDPLSQTGPRNIVKTVERDIAAYEKAHPRKRE